MLKITIPEREYFDERTNRFFTIKQQSLQLEHSLVSISKWESKWEKPFLTKEEKTVEETIDYIRCMTLTQNVDPNVYKGITNRIIDQVTAYIEASMTATWFTEEKKGKVQREVVTSEIIYYWMIALNIPLECQKWHLNRLLTLIRVCNIKNAPPKKMSKNEWASKQRSLNAARRKSLHTKG